MIRSIAENCTACSNFPRPGRILLGMVLKVTQLKYKCSGNHLVEVASGSRWHKTTKGWVKADCGMLVSDLL